MQITQLDSDAEVYAIMTEDEELQAYIGDLINGKPGTFKLDLFDGALRLTSPEGNATSIERVELLDEPPAAEIHA